MRRRRSTVSRVLASAAVGAFAGLLVGSIAMGAYWLRTHEGWEEATPAPLVQAVATPFVPEPLYAIRDIDVTIAPSSSTAVLGTLDEGDEVDVFVIDGGWAAVRFPPDTSGWGWTPATGLYRASEGVLGGQVAAHGGTAAGGSGTSAPLLDTKTSTVETEPVRSRSGSDDVLWMALVVALGMTLVPAGLAWVDTRPSRRRRQ